MDRPLPMGEADDIIGSDAGEETREALERRREALTRWRPSKPRPERPPRARKTRAQMGLDFLRRDLGELVARTATVEPLRPRATTTLRTTPARGGESGACRGTERRARSQTRTSLSFSRVPTSRRRRSSRRGARGSAPRAPREQPRVESPRRAATHGGGACKAPPRAVRLPARRPPRGSGEDQNRQRVRAAP